MSTSLGDRAVVAALPSRARLRTCAGQRNKEPLDTGQRRELGSNQFASENGEHHPCRFIDSGLDSPSAAQSPSDPSESVLPGSSVARENTR